MNYTKHIENANTRKHPFVRYFNPAKASHTISEGKHPKHEKKQHKTIWKSSYFDGIKRIGLTFTKTKENIDKINNNK